MIRTITVAGRFKDTIYSSITELVLNIVFSIGGILACKHLWGNEAGIYGALIGTIVALIYRTFDINHFANKKILNRSAWKSNKIMLINIAIFGVIAYAVRFIPMAIDNYFVFMLYGVVFSVAIIVLFLLVQAMCNFKETKMALGFLRAKLIKTKKL